MCGCVGVSVCMLLECVCGVYTIYIACTKWLKMATVFMICARLAILVA